MVTWDEIKWDGVSRLSSGAYRKFKKGTCLSTDSKPTDLANGSILLEADTGRLYLFDEENSEWRRFA